MELDDKSENYKSISMDEEILELSTKL